MGALGSSESVECGGLSQGRLGEADLPRRRGGYAHALQSHWSKRVTSQERAPRVLASMLDETYCDEGVLEVLEQEARRVADASCEEDRTLACYCSKGGELIEVRSPDQGLREAAPFLWVLYCGREPGHDELAKLWFEHTNWRS